MKNLSKETIEKETNNLLTQINNREIDFSRLYYYYLMVIAFVGLLYTLRAGRQIGIPNEWFSLGFEVGLFILGITMFYAGLTVFLKVRSLRFIYRNFTHRGPATKALNAIFASFSFLAFLNFYIKPSFASLGILLIFVGLIIEVSVTSHYKHIMEKVYNNDTDKTVDYIVERMVEGENVE